MARRSLPPAPVVRQVRAEYVERDEAGGFRYSVHELADRHQLTIYWVYRIARTWGLGRYMTTGRH